MTTLARLHILAARQHWLLTLDQLQAGGLTPSAVRNLVRTGRLHRIHRTVYVLGRPDLSREATWLAAVLACAPGGVLSHLSAGELWDVTQCRAPWPEVSVPSQAGRTGIPKVRLHRPPTLAAADIAVRFGIPATGLCRTLLDPAAHRSRSATSTRTSCGRPSAWWSRRTIVAGTTRWWHSGPIVSRTERSRRLRAR